MVQLLGQILLSKKLITDDDLSKALKGIGKRNICLGKLCVEDGLIDDLNLAIALAEQFSLPFIREDLIHLIDNEFLKEYRLDVFQKGHALPIGHNDDSFVVDLAISDPVNLDLCAEVEYLTGYSVRQFVVSANVLARACDAIFKNRSVLCDSVGLLAQKYGKQMRIDEGNMSVEEILKRTESEPVVKLVNLIFDEAIIQRASDIHIEPLDKVANIRFRIDGMLRHYMEIDRLIYLPLTSRIKILAELDIAEKRVPQDGRIRYNNQSESFDFRISTLPTHHGEKSVIRILKHDLSLLDLNNIGLSKMQLNVTSKIIEKPQGIFFVTGPTGSGKSSTLFACLNRIKNREINITTIENPIEYKLDGVNQTQVNEKAGVTFAATLRSILRQDPDVILVGEIRDKETAKIAVQASQTGHLVMSTLHTNDAISAITRLKDLDIPGFMISSSLIAVMAQRLIRTLCPHCKRKAPIGEELNKRWQILLGSVSFETAYFPVGCEKCGTSGFLGRSAIFEVIEVSESMRTLINDDISETALRKHCIKNGFETLITSGIELIKTGQTTPEEILRVVQIDL